MIRFLEETIPLMQSDSYKDRTKAEYFQTKIRYDKLHAMIIRREAGKLDFKPNCSLAQWEEQEAAMGEYLHQLEVKACIEDIDLYD